MNMQGAQPFVHPGPAAQRGPRLPTWSHWRVREKENPQPPALSLHGGCLLFYSQLKTYMYVYLKLTWPVWYHCLMGGRLSQLERDRPPGHGGTEPFTDGRHRGCREHVNHALSYQSR